MNKLKRAAAFAAAMLMIMMMAAGCHVDPGSEPAKPADPTTDVEKEEKVIKIGVLEPGDGEYALAGARELLGIQYAHSLNSEVEIGGETYEIELVEASYSSASDGALSAAQKLIEEGVSVVLGPVDAAGAASVGSLFAENQIPALCCFSTNPQLTEENEYYFRVCAPASFQGKIMASMAAEQGCQNVGVLIEEGNAYSENIAAAFSEAFEAFGGAVIEGVYSSGTTDFGSVLPGLADCEGIFAPSLAEDAGEIIRQVRAVNSDCLILGTDSWESEEVIETAGSDATNVYFSSLFDESVEREVTAAFTEGYQAWLNADPDRLNKNGGEDTAFSASALAFDAYTAAFEGIRSAGSAGGAEICAALKGVNFEGATGAIAFDENGDVLKETAFIKTIDTASGSFVFLKTQEVAA